MKGITRKGILLIFSPTAAFLSSLVDPPSQESTDCGLSSDLRSVLSAYIMETVPSLEIYYLITFKLKTMKLLISAPGFSHVKKTCGWFPWFSCNTREIKNDHGCDVALFYVLRQRWVALLHFYQNIRRKRRKNTQTQNLKKKTIANYWLTRSGFVDTGQNQWTWKTGLVWHVM